MNQKYHEDYRKGNLVRNTVIPLPEEIKKQHLGYDRAKFKLFYASKHCPVSKVRVIALGGGKPITIKEIDGPRHRPGDSAALRQFLDEQVIPNLGTYLSSIEDKL